jgi:hypothetical protein
VGGVLGVEVPFEETSRPTMVRTDTGDLPTSGRFWIDPLPETVLRSETHFLFERQRATATATTEYRPEAALAMWVPSKMREQYRDNPGVCPALFGTSADATAEYSNYRRFGVTVDEKAHLPEEP